MIANYKSGEWKTTEWYELCFDDGRGNGFAFPCDEKGKVNQDIPDAARINYKFCIEHPQRFLRWNKVVKNKHTYRENPTGLCSCGNVIELWNEYYGTCECPYCGKWYNVFGQELKSPDLWEEETEEVEPW